MTKKRNTSVVANVKTGTHVEREQNVAVGKNVYEVLSYEELVQRENSLKATFKAEADSIKYKLSLYRKSLEGTLHDMERLYNGTLSFFDGTSSLEVKTNIDALCRLSGIESSKFFDVKFVGGLYDTYTFKVVGGDTQVQTLKAVKRKVSDKTDFEALGVRVEKALGFSVDIKATKFTEKIGTKDVVYYWLPTTNFSVSNVLNRVFAVNKDSLFKIEREVLKAAKIVQKRKNKKAAKKDANNSSSVANTDNVGK